MPGLVGSLNHSLERSLRVFPSLEASCPLDWGFFIGSSRSPHALNKVRNFRPMFTRPCLLRNLAARGLQERFYDFDPTTYPKKSGKTRSNKSKTAALRQTARQIGSGRGDGCRP